MVGHLQRVQPVVVLCCDGWCGRLARLLRLDSAAVDACTLLAVVRPAATSAPQAIAAVTVRIDITKLNAIIGIKKRKNIHSVS